MARVFPSEVLILSEIILKDHKQNLRDSIRFKTRQVATSKAHDIHLITFQYSLDFQSNEADRSKYHFGGQCTENAG